MSNFINATLIQNELCRSLNLEYYNEGSEEVFFSLKKLCKSFPLSKKTVKKYLVMNSRNEIKHRIKTLVRLCIFYHYKGKFEDEHYVIGIDGELFGFSNCSFDFITNGIKKDIHFGIIK